MMRIRRVMEFFWLFSKDVWGYGKDEKKRFKFKIAFITLTLSSEQKHTDDYIKQHMLEPFLKWAFREGKDKHYVWKAETQRNGNIHFHITFNGFIHYMKIRQKWNHLQWKHGYISEQADPNSTDVHSVKHTGGFIGYMSKYMSKTDEDLEIYKPSEMLPFKTDHSEIVYGSIAACGLPFYKRRVEGKHWACDRKLVNCSAKIVVHDQMNEDEYISGCNALQAVWNSHIPQMKCDRLKKEFVTIWTHEKDISMNSELHPLVADLFSNAYKTYHGLN